MQNIKIFQLAMLNKTLLNFLEFTLNHNIIDSVRQNIDGLSSA